MQLHATLRLPAAILLLASTNYVCAAEDKYFDSNGIKIHYMDEGEGEPVVLIHGFTANHKINWVGTGVVRVLSQQFRVIAIDVRGHGKSDKPHNPGQYGEELVNDVVKLLDHLKIQRAHIVGYSLGGFITHKMLSERPDRFLTATLAATGWRNPDSDEPHQNVATTPKGNPPSEGGLSPINKMMAGNDPKALTALMHSIGALDVTIGRIKSNTVPTLAIIGEKDWMRESVDDLNRVMPNLDVVVIPGFGHDAIRSPMFVSSLKEFLVQHKGQFRFENTD